MSTVSDPSPRPSPLPPALRVLRLHQWSKNTLVFLAPIGAHRLGDGAVLRAAGLSFLAFGLVASALYVFNDLADRQADRAHPVKRHRPFAAGQLPPAAGPALAALLLASGAAVAWSLPGAFQLVLLAYAATTTAYTLWLKRLLVADVLVLAGLYTLRLYGGALATGLPVSEWLASFSMFLFLSLALLKRGAELVGAGGALAGRSYRAEDRAPIFAMGAASSYAAVLVLSLYLSSPEVRRLYVTPAWLWGLCPLVLYWASRLWLLAGRGQVLEDPVVFALKDRPSWITGALAALVLWLGARGTP